MYMQYTCKLYIYLTFDWFPRWPKKLDKLETQASMLLFFAEVQHAQLSPCLQADAHVFGAGWVKGWWSCCELGLGLCFGLHFFFGKDDTDTHTQTGYQMIVELDDHWISFVKANPNWSSKAWNLNRRVYLKGLQILNSGSTAIDIDIDDPKIVVVSSLIFRDGHWVWCWKNR